MQYRFILEPYKNLKSRHICPKCGKKELTFYIDTLKNEPIHPTVGRCNRESKCTYNYTPKQYFIDNNIISEISPKQTIKTIQVQPKAKEISYIDFEVVKRSFLNYDNNNFVNFLISIFGEIITKQLIKKYLIGTSSHWHGATIFYQKDIFGKIRTGKVMLYNSDLGKRIKKPYDHITWLHRLLKLENFNLSQCLFGSHLLNDKTKPIAIVESEKTAIIASVYLPQFIWLATGGKQNLRTDLFENLHNRKIVFFPDLKCFDLWSEKAKIIGFKNYTISDLLELKATETEKEQGFDLADYLLQFDYKSFVEHKPKVTEPNPIDQTINEVETENPKPIKWNIEELEKFFENIPDQQIKLSKCENIISTKNFAENHLSIIKHNNGKKSFEPYYDRLLKLMNLLKEKTA